LALLSRVRISFVVATLACGGAYALACDDSGNGGADAPTDGNGPPELPDAGVRASDSGEPGTTMRLAHVASSLGPVDFCYRMAKTSAFDGPVLGGGLGGGDAGSSDAASSDGGDADADAVADVDAGTIADAGADPDAGDAESADGGAAAVVYRTVSRYLTLRASGPLTIALVAPGSTSCATPLFTADVTIDPGKLSTVAIVGGTDADGGAAELSLVAFIDDRMTMPSQARVRMIHAALGTTGGRAPAGALAVRASAAQTVTIADRIEPKTAASPSGAVPVDSLGYATIAPVPSPARLAVGAAANAPIPGADASVDSWLSQAGELGLRGGSLHTGFVLSGEGNQSFEVLWCTDTSTSGTFATCVLVR
jgi:hypothetical protein